MSKINNKQTLTNIDTVKKRLQWIINEAKGNLSEHIPPLTKDDIIALIGDILKTEFNKSIS